MFQRHNRLAFSVSVFCSMHLHKMFATLRLFCHVLWHLVCSVHLFVFIVKKMIRNRIGQRSHLIWIFLEKLLDVFFTHLLRHLICCKHGRIVAAYQQLCEITKAIRNNTLATATQHSNWCAFRFRQYFIWVQAYRSVAIDMRCYNNINAYTEKCCKKEMHLK